MLCLPPMLARAPAGCMGAHAGRDPPPVLSGGGRGWAGIREQKRRPEGKGKRRKKERTRAGLNYGLQASRARRMIPLTVRRGEARGLGAPQAAPGLPRAGRRERRPPARQRQPPEEEGRGAGACRLKTPRPERRPGPRPGRAAAPAARGAREAALASRSRPCRAGPRDAARSRAALTAGALLAAAETMEGGSARRRGGAPAPAPALTPSRPARRQAGTRGVDASPAPPGPPGPARPCPVRWPRGRRGRSRWSSGPEATRHL